MFPTGSPPLHGDHTCKASSVCCCLSHVQLLVAGCELLCTLAALYPAVSSHVSQLATKCYNLAVAALGSSQQGFTPASPAHVQAAPRWAVQRASVGPPLPPWHELPRSWRVCLCLYETVGGGCATCIGHWPNASAGLKLWPLDWQSTVLSTVSKQEITLVFCWMCACVYELTLPQHVYSYSAAAILCAAACRVLFILGQLCRHGASLLDDVAAENPSMRNCTECLELCVS